MNLNLRKFLAWLIDLLIYGLFVAGVCIAFTSCATMQSLPLRPALFPLKVVLVQFNSNDSGYLYGYGLIDMKREYYYHSSNEKIELGQVFETFEELDMTKDFKLINDK